MRGVRWSGVTCCFALCLWCTFIPMNPLISCRPGGGSHQSPAPVSGGAASAAGPRKDACKASSALSGARFSRFASYNRSRSQFALPARPTTPSLTPRGLTFKSQTRTSMITQHGDTETSHDLSAAWQLRPCKILAQTTEETRPAVQAGAASTTSSSEHLPSPHAARDCKSLSTPQVRRLADEQQPGSDTLKGTPWHLTCAAALSSP